MSSRSIGLSPELHQYLVDYSVREPDVLQRLRKETADHPEAGMQIAPEQGQFMALLIKMIGARRVLEIGVFTGYSSTAMALALPPEGRLIACDVSEEYTAVARRFWRAAGVEDRIELRLGPAVETLDTLQAEGATFDFAFIDADKEQYDAYYERALGMMGAGGIIALDNMLRGGKVADPAADDEATRSIRAINEKILRDERVDLSLVPIADGLTLVRKR